MKTLFTRLLSPEGQIAARSALVERYGWFTHVSKISYINDIVTNGLSPREHMPSTSISSTIVGSCIICLSPYPKLRTMQLNKGEKGFKLAIASEKLPPVVGVDWSFGGWDAYCARYDSIPDADLGQTFLDIVALMESVVVYERIAALGLRVCPKADPNLPPSEWPDLLSTAVDRIHVLQPDLVGNLTV
jgi:hypothetical protein